MTVPAILISGAGSGIGLATARLFAARGWRVGAIDRDAAALARLRPALGDSGWTRLVDVTVRADVLAGVEAFAEVSKGRLDVLFNNAGIDAKGPFADTAWDTIAAVVQVNLLGGMSLIHAALPWLRATPGSLCLSTASASAIYGQQGMAAYSATKHAVRGLTEALAVELGAIGVRAADLIPGIIDTGMLSAEDKAMLPTEGPFRPISADLVAEAAWAAWEGNRVHWFVPEELAPLDLEARAKPEVIRDRRIAGSPV